MLCSVKHPYFFSFSSPTNSYDQLWLIKRCRENSVGGKGPTSSYWYIVPNKSFQIQGIMLLNNIKIVFNLKGKRKVLTRNFLSYHLFSVSAGVRRDDGSWQRHQPGHSGSHLAERRQVHKFLLRYGVLLITIPVNTNYEEHFISWRFSENYVI